MSGQWEVVGKSKKDKPSGKSKKLSKTEMQKFVDNAPKVEDFCKYHRYTYDWAEEGLAVFSSI